MSETQSTTRPIQEALEKAGYFCMRLNSGVAKRGKYYIKLCPEGTADLLLCPPHQAPIWIETKTEDGNTKPDRAKKQAEFAYDVESLGHRYIKATSLDDVLAVLKGKN